MAYENLLVDVSERIATVTFNRPKSLNALNPPTVRELGTAMEEISSREDVGVVLLTGSGEKAFIAGADISEMKAFTTMQALDFALLGQGVLSFIERMPQPVIGAINGFALGGGCEVAMACDLLVASDTARFGQPEVNLGIIPGYGGTQRLPRLVGRNLAKELVLTGEMISAQRAYEIGLVNKVVPLPDLLPTALSWAERLCENAPLALQATKEVAYRGVFDMTFEEAMRLEGRFYNRILETEDVLEGARAFAERRKPEFKGR